MRTLIDRVVSNKKEIFEVVKRNEEQAKESRPEKVR
jgi:hypothetical protein